MHRTAKALSLVLAGYVRLLADLVAMIRKFIRTVSAEVICAFSLGPTQGSLSSIGHSLSPQVHERRMISHCVFSAL